MTSLILSVAGMHAEAHQSINNPPETQNSANFCNSYLMQRCDHRTRRVDFTVQGYYIGWLSQ
jgi:hypothetical protein